MFRTVRFAGADLIMLVGASQEDARGWLAINACF